MVDVKDNLKVTTSASGASLSLSGDPIVGTVELCALSFLPSSGRAIRGAINLQKIPVKPTCMCTPQCVAGLAILMRCVSKCRNDGKKLAQMVASELDRGLNWLALDRRLPQFLRPPSTKPRRSVVNSS